jgi:hypothetical protein
LRANPRFLSQGTAFWAHVRTISQEVGYTDRKTKKIRVPSRLEIQNAFEGLQLETSHIFDANGNPSKFGSTLIDYFKCRASILNNTVQTLLMNKNAAEAEFKKLRAALRPNCPLPMNKQKGEKKNFSFLTCMVNMLVEANIGGNECDYDPRSLTTITHNAKPFMTLARRVDGAFPRVVNPTAIWEIKEYYYTTTFGSRVADGVYETLLDGMELTELLTSNDRKVYHLLVIDDHFTWWQCGRSYLCRIIDMLHMGLVDEVIFGREVLTRLPVLVREWRTEYESSRAHSGI